MTSGRIGTINNLEVGGSYDLLMVKIEGTFPEGKISFGLYDTPMKITGLQKVVQTFLKVLLTTKGSDLFYPSRGTFFPSLTVNANQLTDDNALVSDISDTIKDGSNQVRSMLNVNTVDLSSALDSVEILGIDRIPEGIFLYLQVTTMAGQFASVAVPFPEFGLN
jgi:hypothetical protein